MPIVLPGKTPYELLTEGTWDWKGLTTWYEEALNELSMPDDADHNDIKRMDKKTDTVYRIFRKDYGRISERKNKIDRYIKRVTTKATGDSSQTNDVKRKADGIRAAESCLLDQGQPAVNLYVLEDQYAAYLEYFDYVKDVLERKVGLLNRALGSNKIDSWLTK
jgi:hypothetical protein